MFRTSLAPAAIALALAAAPAQAGLLPSSVSVIPDSSGHRWTYAIVLPTDMKLQSGNYFTVYDFGGYRPGLESAPAGWAFTASKSGPTPDMLTPVDNPDLWNLSWKYTGPSVQTGQIGLGNFWAYSDSGMGIERAFTSETFRSADGDADLTVDRNVTRTTAPLGADTPPVGVPEPATLLLGGLGLTIVGLRRRSAV